MSITFIHNFHTEVSTVNNICPVLTPKAVNQIPAIGQVAKKCKEQELLKLVDWKIN
ncbi:hypothetical protein SLEP1_g1231 [Rubroshorea leprosula]|uniref:Uncharacterized protein n=1 Tax=Rubroshorea leprosula TaxID=152421 RepID=A0AAV5HM85_9ROSI|nr:hypothetical protein SLEP1_g1231 [Rubroshorea leprosula]